MKKPSTHESLLVIMLMVELIWPENIIIMPAFILWFLIRCRELGARDAKQPKVQN